MKYKWLIRVVGALLLGAGALALRNWVITLLPEGNSFPALGLLLAVGGVLLGYFLAPVLITRPLLRVQHLVEGLPLPTLVAGWAGFFIGLIFGAISAYPLSILPAPLGEIAPLVATCIFAYLGIVIMTHRRELSQPIVYRLLPHLKEEQEESLGCSILLDTSVIIDGRIADIVRTGFLQGELVIPLFVLNELQHIADSADMLRRNRGRRGLEILRRLQDESPIPVRISDVEVPGVQEVDDKLIALAKSIGGSILTNDYNLNRVADLQGVRVLNINELANAVRAVYLPGETFELLVMQEGKEHDQGVGYLDDGTMVVVEDGRTLIGKTLVVTVTKVLQTAAGRMIFARPNLETVS